jgi:hypothetical protein
MKEIIVSQWIYFLKTTQSLPQNYFVLSSNLKKFQIDLIPVTVSDLLVLSKREATFSLMIMIQNTLQRKFFYNELQKILFYLLQNKELALYFFSSFSELRQLVTNPMKARDLLAYFSYPVSTDEIILKIAGIEKLRLEKFQNNLSYGNQKNQHVFTNDGKL